MDLRTRQQHLARWARALSPDNSLESIGGDQGSPGHWIETAPGGAQEKDLARAAVDKLSRGEGAALQPSEMSAFEAIVLPAGRPVLDVVRDSFERPPAPWEHLDEAQARRRIEATLPAIGRIEAPEHPQLPYVGTGFVVGDGLLMTNRHVAEIFTTGLGTRGLSFRLGLEPVNVDFKREVAPTPPAPLRLTKVLMVHPYWDMALLEVEGLGERQPLVLQAVEPNDLRGHDVVVVGYPAQDSRNDFALQNRIFRGVFEVKRLQPGKLTPRRETSSFGNRVAALTHDSSTLGGNSGSAIVDVATGHVVGLHFGGVYLDANFGVPAFEMKREPRLRHAGVCFSDDPVADDPPWARVWVGLERPAEVKPKAPQATDPPDAPDEPPTRPGASSMASLVASAAPTSVSVSLPLQITISFGTPVAAAVGEHDRPRVIARDVAQASASELETTAIDPDWPGREGYDPDFLGERIPLPGLSEALAKATVPVPKKYRGPHGDAHILAYHHYSLAFHATRRQAWFSAANVDGDRRFAFKRGKDRWFIDPRIDDPAAPKYQMGEELYAEDDTDRGHLTRYLDVAWGDDEAEAVAATNDTFHFTNCSLQLSNFNQGKDRWQGIERFLLEEKARKEKRRMVVMTGPVFKRSDPVYRNRHMSYAIRVPLRFWKVCALERPDGTLACTGFVLGQPDIANLPGFEERFDVSATQVAIADLETMTGLDFGVIKGHDHFAANGQSGTLEVLRARPSRMVPLRGLEDIVV